ncbi:MAG: hypothetical protein ACI9JN_002134, partial [Bacteroidia bacterium]
HKGLKSLIVSLKRGGGCSRIFYVYGVFCRGLNGFVRLN